MKVLKATLDTARRPLADFAARRNLWLYARAEFLDFLTRAVGGRADVLLAEANGAIVGMLPFLSLECPGMGRIVNSLPWYGSHGGCTIDTQADVGAVRTALLNAFCAEIDAPDVVSSVMILSHAEEEAAGTYRNALAPTALDHRIGQVTKLPEADDDATLLALYAQKTRNLVRKALKQGFSEEVRDDDAAWDALHHLHAENMAAIGGKAKPRAHLEALRATIPLAMRRLSLATEGGAVAAAMLVLYGGRTAEYVTPAVRSDMRPRQPLSFLVHLGLQDAIRRGMTDWNWGGTWVGQTALHHFKAGFGAEDRPYSYLVKASPSGLAAMKSRRAELGALFPYFYTYPYAALDSA
ncbi:MAG: GNAT family N-acetyltransferase [Parvularculaceae bacterium]|nr:GNAT family N-acetyltransferase [Parvularculaceae bacterium]